MRISMDSCIVCYRFGEEKALELLKAAGFDCVDYSLHNLDAQFLADEEKCVAYARKMRKVLDEVGLVCNQAHAPFRFKEIDDSAYTSIISTMQIASILGAENIIVHPIVAVEGDTLVERNYRFYKRLEEYCERFNIHIAIENIFGNVYDKENNHYINNRFDDPKQMLELIEKLNSEWFVCCVDIGHAVLSGCEPDEYIRGLNSKVLKALHIQDNYYTYEDAHTLPYLGKINWNKVTDALRDIGYDGDLTFEVFNFVKAFENELIPHALALVVAVGRNLEKKICEQ